MLQCLDLRAEVVTADALLTQRHLSVQIVDGGSDFLWTVKEKQDTLYHGLERLFAPEPVEKGFSPAAHDDFRTFTTFDKGHGWHEWRTLTVSSALKDYLDWPYMAQVFKLEPRFVRLADGKPCH